MQYNTLFNSLVDSGDTDETDDSTMHEFESNKLESGPGKLNNILLHFQVPRLKACQYNDSDSL